MWWTRQLFSPLVYLRIYQGPDRLFKSKRFYDFVLPIVLGVITGIIQYLLPIQPALIGDGGIFEAISDLLRLLVAFFIAALAATATFDRPTMDEPLRGHPAYLDVWDSSRQMDVQKSLTRRQFVCHMFGYLAFVSLFLFVCIMFASAIHPTWNALVEEEVRGIARIIISFGFWIMFWNIIVTTLLGIYFLSDRMQHED